MNTNLQLLTDFTSYSPIQVRRWFVENITLAPISARQYLESVEPTKALLDVANGNAPSAEHAGVASRLIYEYMKRPTDIMAFPTIGSPKSWNSPDTMASVLLWAFEPWKRFRYDPRSETVCHTLPSGQWAFHLKGKDSENFLIVQVQRMINELRAIGFTEILKHMSEQGLVSIEIPKGMEASDWAIALQACDHVFNKFCDRAGAVKEMTDQFVRLPIMFFDTSTVNCVQNLVAVGNGVIPTTDVIYTTEESEEMLYPAGKLIPADIEFVLSSATGLAWPVEPTFEEFVEHRVRIHYGLTEESMSDWADSARIATDILLERYCPTYHKFLDHAFPPNPTHEERDAFLRLLGAACFGTNLKLIAAMIGAPNAGKDTVIKWLTMLLGDGQCGVLSPTAFSANTDDQRAFAPLKGARVAILSGEVGEGRGAALLAEKLKSVTSGGGTLTVAEKYEKPTTIFFDGMLVVQGNSIPMIQGGDKALYQNRLIAVEFKHPFPLTSTSYEREYRREAPRFLQVIFLAYLDYIERGGGMAGVDPPEAWRTFREEVELAADPLAVIDGCITAPSKGIEIQSPTFYKALSILAERQLGIKYTLSAQRWAQRLKRSGVVFDRSNSNAWRSRVNRTDYTGWLMHFTLDADKSNGFFTQQDWTNALAQAAMSSV